MGFFPRRLWLMGLLGWIAGCGSGGVDETPPPEPGLALWERAQSSASLESGRRVWVETCIRCHRDGRAGAPMIGDRDAWGERIAQGMAVLVEHATKGFVGKRGTEMPARGGNAELSDQQVALAVAFMVKAAEQERMGGRDVD